MSADVQNLRIYTYSGGGVERPKARMRGLDLGVTIAYKNILVSGFDDSKVCIVQAS